MLRSPEIGIYPRFKEALRFLVNKYFFLNYIRQTPCPKLFLFCNTDPFILVSITQEIQIFIFDKFGVQESRSDSSFFFMLRGLQRKRRLRFADETDDDVGVFRSPFFSFSFTHHQSSFFFPFWVLTKSLTVYRGKRFSGRLFCFFFHEG